ncbi:MAG TPA: hypothetical protein DD729_08265 [Rhodobacteraceae bacterium]|jgi:hypothetical protein|nr:hypothetical protein [Paracoccaceae bacterium]
MTSSPDLELLLRQKKRAVAVVITFALALWLGAWWVRGQFGVTPIFTTMLNLITLAAFFWSMIASYQILRIRRQIRAEAKPEAQTSKTD